MPVTVCVSEPGTGVRLVQLDRPARRNALDLATIQALAAAVSDAPGLRAVVLGSTTPGTFCAGVDLRVPDAERAAVSDRLYGVYAAMLELPVPVVAAVDGAAVGGGAQLVLAADVRLVSPGAAVRFGGPGQGLAVGAWGLPSAVGRGAALEAVLGQRLLDAVECVRLGLVERVVTDPLADALALAGSVAALDADAVRRAKALVVRGERLVERLDEERRANAAVFTGRVR